MSGQIECRRELESVNSKVRLPTALLPRGRTRGPGTDSGTDEGRQAGLSAGTGMRGTTLPAPPEAARPHTLIMAQSRNIASTHQKPRAHRATPGLHLTARTSRNGARERRGEGGREGGRGTGHGPGVPRARHNDYTTLSGQPLAQGGHARA
eukprot:7386800-Prymnesium_polylepis.3